MKNQSVKRLPSMMPATVLLLQLVAMSLGLGAPGPGTPALPGGVIAERGPHHRVWRAGPATALGNEGGACIELATGLHYFEDGAWRETREEIEIIEGTAMARRGPHKVTFAANLNSPGAISLVSPDGLKFRSHVLGLAYTD